MNSINRKYFIILFIILTLFSIQAPIGITVFPLFIIFILPLLFLYWLIFARKTERRNRKSYKIIVTSMFVIIISFIVSIGIIRWQTIKSKENGDKIVKSIENYHSIKNKYPSQLEEMIPQFMISIPYSYMGYGNIKFDYKLNQDSSNYIISFPNAAVFNTRYNSEIREWKTE